ncbi:CubicO group peptidase, beta-lactamase class C family [Parasphingorhabdus marina DSM 22363]|uniref:CubicO group peptidase, beta-lactamase class C family n=1 Tax=Parasphingorhabdus marina DSM 22363 TaxID=1123272 RepID=A0A1N6CNA0_9SPHN|nr:serine hydrolase [Parasphingorhabdus marina]SIN59834.1 CubicO group peptidase, beta-lactamase class C family [Parasphingorhabdus marina DSM 22363]
MRPFRSALGLSVIASTLATSHVPALAETPEEALASRFRAVEALIDAQMTKEAVPGAAIGIVHDQNLIWSHQYGVESLRTGAPVTNDTLFSICSVSKLFTGVAAMNLVEDGKLRLDAPVSDYLGGLRLQDRTKAEEPVTIRNILSHVSGLPRESAKDHWADNSFPDLARLRADIPAHQQLYRPYDHWQYSNLGMSMLGDAVGSASGSDWGQYVREEILQPLGMTRTTTDMPFDQVGQGFARGYYVRSAKGERKPVAEHQFRSFAPAAGIASSVNDMAKFASWHFRLHRNGGEEVLRATTLKNMQRVHWVGPDFNEPAWGLAYATRRYGEKTMWGHGGYCPGARTEFVMRLPDQIGMVMMTSANDVSPGSMVRTVYSLTEGAIRKVHGAKDEKKKPAESQSDAKKDVNLRDYEGYYLVENYDWDVYVGVNEDGLFAMPVFNNDPAGNMETWQHVEGDTFRRKRKDDTLAEAIIFEREADGRVNAYAQHSYRYSRR